MPERMDEMKGSVKEAVGKAVGNERLAAEGSAQHDTAKATRETKGAADQVKGNLKMAAGKALGNERLHAEGQADDMRGTLKRAG
jgi:uncharacterized protein YjbJ (UPF0337 family)